MQILRLSIYTGRRRSFVITYLSQKKNTVQDSVYIQSRLLAKFYLSSRDTYRIYSNKRPTSN